MIKYIDSEAFFKAINTLMYRYTTGYLDASIYNGAISDVADILTHFPAADVEEVVRCKECRYRHTYCDITECDYMGDDCEDEGYCSYGVRKDEGKGKMNKEIMQYVLDWYKNSHTKENYDVDIAKVVRCKDCKMYRRDKELAEAKYCDPNYYCGLLQTEMDEDGYCSYGRRKDE